MSGYFLYHSIGTFPGKREQTAVALSRFAEMWSAEDDQQWHEALAARDHFIQSWERLVGAARGSMTTTENVTAALSSLIGALPQNRLRGKRVLIAQDCFPSLHFLLAGLQDHHGFTLDTVPCREGTAFVEDEDYIARWDGDVGLALITWVTSAASKVADIPRLLDHARRMSALTVVDVTQGVGILPFAVDGFDVMIGSSLKWLCGFPGAGMLYVRPDLLTECRPTLRGWFSQPNPFSWALDSFSYADDARRFDHGTPAILATIASQPGLDFVTRTGVEALRAHNLNLARRLMEAALGFGLRPVSPVDDSRRGGSVMLQAPSLHQARMLISNLNRDSIFADNRGKILRFSPGVMTSGESLDQLIEAIASWALALSVPAYEKTP
jgi:kynureninase